MMPDHQNYFEWMRKGIEYSISAISRPADIGNNTVKNGKSVDEWLVLGTNYLNDGTMINHNIIHPDYIASPILCNFGSMTTMLSGELVPEGAIFNTEYAYDALVDLNFSSPPYYSPGGTCYVDGTYTIYHPQGNDWGIDLYENFAVMDVFAGLFGYDSLASQKADYWEPYHAQKILDMQNRFTDGHTYLNDTENYAVIKEEKIPCYLGLAYLGKCIFNQGTFSLTNAEYQSEEYYACSASSCYNSEFTADNAFDEVYYDQDSTNCWASTTAGAVGAWWKVDLGAVTGISTVKVQYRGYGAPVLFHQVPRTVTFQVSNNGTDWTTVISKSTNVPTVNTAYNQNLYTYNLNTTGRYVRLLCEDGSQEVCDEFVEVEVYRNSSNITATASSEYSSSFTAAKAADGVYYASDWANCWASTSAGATGAWWKADLGDIRNISTVKVQYRGFGTPVVFHQIPRSVTFQVSNNGTDWTTVISKSTSVPIINTTYSQDLYSYNINTAGRYVRLLCEEGTQDFIDAFVEVEVETY